MAISTNSIIHYTDSIDKIKGIISEGFKVKFCVENIITRGELKLSGAFPLVSFCDIPLSDAKKHLDSYGYYGIGLKKTWAINNGLNPVLYIDRASDIGAIIRKIGIKGVKESGELDNDFINDFVKICSYIKNYDGPLIRASKTEESYRFYDEREWRYVPSKDLVGDERNAIVVESYLKEKEKYNDFASKIKLEFAFNEITYLIVKEEEDIPVITKHLRDVYSNKCTVVELEILLTRILTASQVINDF